MIGPPWSVALLLVHLAATWFMVGLIWLVQVVHYPLLAGADPARYTEHQQQHMRRIGWIVGPAMLVEALTAVGLLISEAPWMPTWLAWTNLALLAAIWLSTALVQVPCHGRLLDGFDAACHDRLVRTNWLRTGLWSVRGLLLLGAMGLWLP